MANTSKFRQDFQQNAHPGAVLKEELNCREIKQKDFAMQINLQPSHLSEIIKGKRPITQAIAQSMEQILQIPAQFWVNMQTNYDLEMLQLERMGKEEADAAKKLNDFNGVIDVSTLLKRCEKNNLTEVEKWNFCQNAFGFSDSSTIISRAGFFHKSEKTGLDERMILTWILLAKQSVSSKPKPIGIFNQASMIALSKELSSIFHDNHNTIERVDQKLSEYGIHFSICEKVNHASIDGYSFIESNGIPAIVVTKRYPRIDNFAFAVLHEIGHLALGHLTLDSTDNFRINIVTDSEEIDEDENLANSFAANALIPDYIWNSEAPVVRPNPYLIQNDYCKWAEKNHFNKWIVLGRLSFETGMYKFTSDGSRGIA